MTSRKSYSRYFIILQEDEKGYALASDKLPSGYAKLEIKNDKCRVSYYVQNLKKSMEPYRNVLISSKKNENKLILLGNMNIDEFGRADVSYEYSIGEAEKLGIVPEKISGAAIMKLDRGSSAGVMSGFTGNEIPKGWTHYSFVEIGTSKETKNEKPMVFNENVKKQIKEQVEEVKKELKAQNNNDSSQENSTMDVNIQPVEENVNIFDEYERRIDDSKKEKQSDKHDEDDKEKYEPISEFFTHLAEGFEEVEDVCSDVKKCKWYKVSVNNMSDLMNTSDYNKYTIAYYPMMIYYPYIKNYGHFLMGYKSDSSGKMKYIVYGIPGKKEIEDQPFLGKSGFVTWVSFDKNESDMGYWLMFYDFKNSVIVIPVK